MLIARGQLHKQKTNQLVRAHLSPHHQPGGPLPSAQRPVPRVKRTATASHQDGDVVITKLFIIIMHYEHLFATFKILTLTMKMRKCAMNCYTLMRCHPNRHHIAKRPHIFPNQREVFTSVTDLSIF